MKKMYMSKRKKYIIGGTTAMAVAIASCGFGVYNHENVQANRYDTECLASNDSEGIDVEKEDNDETDALVSQLTGSLNVEHKDIYKDETVYVFSNASGKTSKILVNEHLNNRDGKSVLTDKTDLKDVVNLKGDETYTINGGTIEWKAAGNDIYYQGTSDKELPVQVKVTYYLNGKEISPDNLAGKSGRVKIRFDYTNTTSVTKKINGKDEKIKVPFVAVSGMVLGNNFTNITVENGKTMAEGGSNIVVGYAVPGLMDSIGVDEDDFSEEFSIPEYFEVSADVTDFSLDMTVTLVMNGSEVNLVGGIDLDDLDSVVDSISEAGIQLADGSGELAEGVNTLLGKMGEFNTGVNNLNSALGSLSGGSASLASGVSAIDTSAQSINAGVATLDAALNTPMTDVERQAVADSAAAVVSAQFAEGTDTYNYIYSQATSAFSSTMTSESTISAIYNGLYANLHDSLYYAAVANAVEASGGTVNKEDIIASQGAAIEASIQQQLYALASGIASNVSEGGQAAVGQNMVAACSSAASQAAGQGAISGAEGAKAQIASQIETVQANGYSLVTGASALASGTSELAGKVPELTNGISAILSGTGSLSEGSSQLTAGVTQLSEGAITLNDGMVQLNDDAIQTIVKEYNGDVKNIVSRVKAAFEATTEYDTYTMLSDGDAGVTKFIIKTEGISAEK